MKLLFLFITVLFFSHTFAQPKIEEDLKTPFQNAVKGIYWALDNIPVKKMNLENDLIADNKLYANVKLSKQVNGVTIKSTGYDNSYEILIVMYRTYESLEREGFIIKPKEETNIEEEEEK